ncbi:DnaJ domain-containing protein [Gamsiella multidivaricata]|uniref:DnaJ domain-containing protein n=1 Tax=Gamsiella multidivaricata TaxID=101098 RepID=UPI00222059A1|nr:DnaJ domain-containing protein [Gamsiella multidivaricata]KAG0366346.1 hypothetical protein BGZ54_005457 [Gamsiella multidivaricata]KAI7829615.1 DnaJ domain-containing protein [Gamsiella multidivaricata]
MRTCHYIILGIEKNASDLDIKKAYRRKALEWHPDKNHYRVEEATKQFAFIAEAYEVLSDPQERAWYDSHRDAILRGDDKSEQSEGAAGTTSAELMKFFSTSVYKGFRDDSAGFYTVYRNLFEKLAQEEVEAVANDRYEESTGSNVHYPSFGCSTTAYDDNSDSDVKQFYNAWLTFSSQKSFSWCDKYRLTEAPDRRVRRAMEKENKKFRDAARKEFNDTVLSLASYVRKRDPRYIAYQEQQKQKQKQVQADIKARLEKEKELLRAKAGKFQEQEWTRVQDDDENNESGSDDDGTEDEFDQEYECIICDKFFKSERQWKNHERSKRHLKAAEDIRLEMLHEENQLMGLSPKPSEENQVENGELESGDEEEALETPSTRSKAADETEDLSAGSDLDDLEEPVETAAPVYSDLKSKKRAKKKKVMATGLDIDEAEIDELDQDGLADLLGSVRMSSLSSPLGRSRASTPNSRRSRAQKDHWEGDSDKDQDGETPLSTAPVSRAESPDGLGGGNGKSKKLSAKEKKKARSERAAQKLADSGESALKCRICSTDFESKNQLFSHIKETGHALAPAVAVPSGSTTGTSTPDNFFSSDDEQTRGKGKKGRGKRK